MAVTRLGSVTGVDRGATPGAWTTQSSASTPTLTFEDAVRAYQAQYATPSKASYEAIFDYLKGKGFSVERPTHAGGTLLSDDKVVDSTTGKVYDIVFAVDDPNQARWAFNDVGYWVNGKPSATPPPGTGTALGGSAGTAARQPGEPREPGGSRQDTGPGAPGHPAHGGDPGSGGTKATGSTGSTTGADYSAAYEAMRRGRSKASAGGRRGTILGGYGAGAPSTRRATLLGA